MFTSFIFLVLLSANIDAIEIGHFTQWRLQNKNESIDVAAKVPGGVYSDLRTAGGIGDILSGSNDVLTRWVAYDTWTYKGLFHITSEQLKYEVANLVLEGVDTVAFIELNDSPVGSTNNMFVRYVFDVKQRLTVGDNVLKVTFASPTTTANLRSDKYFTAPACVPDEYHGECHANQLRKMQASFGWDWGPAFPSVGLWKPAYFEFYNSAVISYVTTHIEKIYQYWQLNIKIYLDSNPKKGMWKGLVTASINVDGNHKISISNDVEAMIKNDGTAEVELNMMISENVVSLWWPNGFGTQQLYELTVSIHSDTGRREENHSKKLKIGFRTLELVEEEASLILDNTAGGRGRTFYFKVNGYPIFMKGSNWIPAHILPENSYDKGTVDELLLAARDTHMAMLRVWGGGVYESDYFYERCDQLGILIWQDLLFACSMYPVDTDFLDTVRTEIEQNVKRLQHHPSIAVWAGNNENEVALRGNWYNTQPEFEKYKQEYIKLYVNTIKPIVEQLDPGRRYLVSSPSNGKESEDEGYIALNPYDSHYGDTHYYNYLSDNWDLNIYPKTRFASEYGFQSLPSLSTMKTATVDPNDYRLDSEYSKHRQHSPNGYDFITNQMSRHLKLDENDKEHFQKYVFYSQISQAMSMKAETEFYRQSQEDWYTMGALYWQLNDVWQAPSWSGIEYGGRWKMLHYYAKSFFAPVLVSPRLLPTHDVEVYLINDRLVPISDAEIIVEVFNWSSLTPISSHSIPADVVPLSAKKQTVLSMWQNNDTSSTFLRFSLKAPGVLTSPYNYVFPRPLKDVQGIKEPQIQISVTRGPAGTSNKQFLYYVNINVDTVVLFLWLETDTIDGRFEDNGIIVTQPNLKIHYLSNVNVTPKDLEEAIRYDYYTN